MEELYGEILIYQTEDGLTNINVKMQDDTVWLTQQFKINCTVRYVARLLSENSRIKSVISESEKNGLHFSIMPMWKLQRNGARIISLNIWNRY